MKGCGSRSLQGDKAVAKALEDREQKKKAGKKEKGNENEDEDESSE